jgi:hypothetical protein
MPRHQGKARVHKGGNTFSIVIKLYLKKKKKPKSHGKITMESLTIALFIKIIR